MVAGKKVDVVIISLEDGSYLKLTNEYAEAFSKLGGLYRILLALTGVKKEGEAIYNDGKGQIKQLSEVVL